MKWYVYILHCDDNSYYVGHTNSVERRFTRHLARAGAKHTSVHAPIKVAHKEEFTSEIDATRREGQIKGWTRAKKQALILGDMEKLRDLSRSHD